MPSPFVHSLLPTACVLTSTQKRVGTLQRHWNLGQWLRFIGLTILMANFPDIDILPATLFPTHYQEIHRAWGHNIFSGLLWSYIGAWALVRFVSDEFRSGKGLWLSMTLVASHLFLDATAQHSLFGSNPAVPLFWPFSQKIYTVPITVFETMNFSNLPPHLLSLPFDQVLSVRFWREIIQCELMPSFLLYCIFWLMGEVYQFAISRFNELRANRYGLRAPEGAISTENNLV